jgi:hypothetical protein
MFHTKKKLTRLEGDDPHSKDIVILLLFLLLNFVQLSSGTISYGHSSRVYINQQWLLFGLRAVYLLF